MFHGRAILAARLVGARSCALCYAPRPDPVGILVGADTSSAFDPALLRDADMRAWQHARQVEDSMAPATTNGAITALRSFGTWLVVEGIVSEHPTRDMKDLPLDPPAPRSILTEAIDTARWTGSPC